MSILHRTFADMKRFIRWDDAPYKESRLKTPTEVELSGRAKCADAMLYLKERLKDYYFCLPVRMLIKSDRNIGLTHRDRWVHVFMIVYDGDDLYLAEWRWCEMLSGIFGPFDSLPSLISFVERFYLTLLREKYKQQFWMVYAPFDNPVYGCTLEEMSFGDGVFEPPPYNQFSMMLNSPDESNWKGRRMTTELNKHE